MPLKTVDEARRRADAPRQKVDGEQAPTYLRWT